MLVLHWNLPSIICLFITVPFASSTDIIGAVHSGINTLLAAKLFKELKSREAYDDDLNAYSSRGSFITRGASQIANDYHLGDSLGGFRSHRFHGISDELPLNRESITQKILHAKINKLQDIARRKQLAAYGVQSPRFDDYQDYQDYQDYSDYNTNIHSPSFQLGSLRRSDEFLSRGLSRGLPSGGIVRGVGKEVTHSLGLANDFHPPQSLNNAYLPSNRYGNKNYIPTVDSKELLSDTLLNGLSLGLSKKSAIINKLLQAVLSSSNEDILAQKVEALDLSSLKQPDYRESHTSPYYGSSGQDPYEDSPTKDLIGGKIDKISGILSPLLELLSGDSGDSYSNELKLAGITYPESNIFLIKEDSNEKFNPIGFVVRALGKFLNAKINAVKTIGDLGSTLGSTFLGQDSYENTNPLDALRLPLSLLSAQRYARKVPQNPTQNHDKPVANSVPSKIVDSTPLRKPNAMKTNA